MEKKSWRPNIAQQPKEVHFSNHEMGSYGVQTTKCFVYVDIYRDEDGNLLSWEEHDKRARYQAKCDRLG